MGTYDTDFTALGGGNPPSTIGFFATGENNLKVGGLFLGITSAYREARPRRYPLAERISDSSAQWTTARTGRAAERLASGAPPTRVRAWPVPLRLMPACRGALRLIPAWWGKAETSTS